MSGKQKEEYVGMEKKLKDMGVELNELAIAMCDYIQTGQKTEQLSKFWDNEDSFIRLLKKNWKMGIILKKWHIWADIICYTI